MCIKIKTKAETLSDSNRVELYRFSHVCGSNMLRSRKSRMRAKLQIAAHFDLFVVFVSFVRSYNQEWNHQITRNNTNKISQLNRYLKLKTIFN